MCLFPGNWKLVRMPDFIVEVCNSSYMSCSETLQHLWVNLVGLGGCVFHFFNQIFNFIWRDWVVIGTCWCAFSRRSWCELCYYKLVVGKYFSNFVWCSPVYSIKVPYEDDEFICTCIADFTDLNPNLTWWYFGVDRRLKLSPAFSLAAYYGSIWMCSGFSEVF